MSGRVIVAAHISPPTLGKRDILFFQTRVWRLRAVFIGQDGVRVDQRWQRALLDSAVPGGEGVAEKILINPKLALSLLANSMVYHIVARFFKILH